MTIIICSFFRAKVGPTTGQCRALSCVKFNAVTVGCNSCLTQILSLFFVHLGRYVLVYMASLANYDYQGLEPLYREIAKRELKEDPEKIRAHIASLRNWLRQSRHIQNCPEDDKFLLQFLRVAKFDHEKAQGRLEVFCTLRGSELHGCPSFFEFPSLEEENLRYYLRCGFQLPCGYNDKGESVFLGCMKGWDPEKISYADLTPYMYMGAEVILSDERCQIAGVSAVFDLEGFNKKQLDDIMKCQKIMKDEMRVWQEGMPLRNKDFYYYREPLIFDMVFVIFEFWMKEKLRKRIHRVKSDLSKIHAKMPGAKRILPREYGGDNGTMAELTDKWVEQFYAFYRKPNPLKDIKIDESKRPKETLKFMKEYSDYPDDIFGKKGTYTKIDAF